MLIPVLRQSEECSCFYGDETSRALSPFRSRFLSIISLIVDAMGITGMSSFIPLSPEKPEAAGRE